MQNISNLNKVNLNLLVSLKALLDERNVSKAANRLNVTQPTLSRNLSQLREYFQDPLLVRCGNKFILTPTAQDLKDKLDMVLEGVGGLFSKSFEPSSHSRQFIIAAPDYATRHILADVMALMLSVETKVQFTIVNWDQSAKDKLIAGEIHLAISIDDKFPQNMYQRVLAEDELAVVARPDHPLAELETLTAEDIVQYPHIEVCTGGGWSEIVDDALRARKLQRNLKLRLDSYSTALDIIERTNLICVMPMHVVANSRNMEDYFTVQAPLALPNVRVSLWWHECFHKDPAHAWLRDDLFPKMQQTPQKFGQSSPSNFVDELRRPVLMHV